MLKRHRCFVNWLLERRKFKSVSMTMSEVAATGMEQLYPGVCSEGLPILMHTFPGDTCKYRCGQTLYSSHTRFSYDLRSRRAETEAHVLRFVVIKLIQSPYLGSQRHCLNAKLMSETKEFEFKFPDRGVAPHPTILKIVFEYQAIHGMITSHAKYVEKEKETIRKSQDEETKNVHKDYEGEAKEIIQHFENEIIDKYGYQDEMLSELDNSFNHAAFLLTYSYFANIISVILHDESIDGNKLNERVDNLLSQSNASFSEDAQNKYTNIVGNVRLLRNLLTHNYNRISNDMEDKSIPKGGLEAAKRESDKGIGFTYMENIGFVIEPQYVLHILEAEKDVLMSPLVKVAFN